MDWTAIADGKCPKCAARTEDSTLPNPRHPEHPIRIIKCTDPECGFWCRESKAEEMITNIMRKREMGEDERRLRDEERNLQALNNL